PQEDGGDPYKTLSHATSVFISVGPTGQAIVGTPLRGHLDGILAGPPTPFSEKKLESKLHLTRRCSRTCDAAVCRIYRARAGDSALAEHAATRQTKVRMIGYIENFGSDLNRLVFGEFYRFQQSKVDIRQSRSRQRIPAEVAIEADSGKSEARCVKPVIGSGVRQGVAARNIVRSRR